MNQDISLLTRKCTIAGHQKINVYHVCIYSECNISRFLCAQCLTSNQNHQHQQSDNKHILNKDQLQQKLKVDFNKRMSITDKQINEFKQLLKVVENFLKSITDILVVIKYGNQYVVNNKQIDEILQKLNYSGLNQIDDSQLDTIIKQDDRQTFSENYQQIQNQSSILIQQAIQIKNLCQTQQTNQEKLSKQIQDDKYSVQKIDETKTELFTSAISSNLKYIVSGGRDKILKIWNYQDNKFIKQIEYYNSVYICKFTNDSKLLYVGSSCTLYQYDVVNKFQEIYNQSIHQHCIFNIYCITNTIVLTSSSDQTIIKTDTISKQILLLIKAHNHRIDGLDYNNFHNLIASGSNDKSIKVWNGNDGQLILHQECQMEICQVLFLQHKNYLISLDLSSICIIWDINYEQKQLKHFKYIRDSNFIFNISLIFDQQLLIVTSQQYQKIYTVQYQIIKYVQYYPT